MPYTKRPYFSLFILSLLTCNTSTANEYPAPPGHYGQDKILENSMFNTGKGSPYISILPVTNAVTEPTTNTTPGNQPKKPQAEKITDIAKMPDNKVTQPAMAAQQAEPTSKAGQTLTQPIYSPAPETAPSRFQQAATDSRPRQEIYPDAGELSHYYKQSRSLPFDQWGEEIPEPQGGQSQQGKSNLNMPLQVQQYDYPQPRNTANTGYPPAQMNQTYQGSPDLAAQMFNTQPYPAPAPGYKLPPSGNRPYNNPLNMMEQFWGNNSTSGFMAPMNNQLKSFEQFPVPQNVYGPSQMNPPTYGGNTQYFRQIPKEEIIYPPHYPGKR
jgi:hypothetical protein